MSNYKNKKWLLHEYVILERSLNKIGKKCGVSGTTIMRWLQKYNIPRRTISESLMGEKNPMYDKNFTRDHRDRLSASKTGEKHPMYGKTFIHTEETRAKMSIAKIGEKHPMYGKTFTHTKETKAKISISSSGENHWNFNKITSEETKARISVSMSGENHPNYIDGRSFLPYCHLFNFKKKEEIRNRWDRICVLTDLMRSTLGSNAGLDDFEGHEIFSGRRHSVHHVFGNKMGGCDGTELVLIPLQNKFNTTKFDGLKLENNPFYITLFMFKDMEKKHREEAIMGDDEP